MTFDRDEPTDAKKTWLHSGVGCGSAVSRNSVVNDLEVLLLEPLGLR
jgi:hypothetical protein